MIKNWAELNKMLPTMSQQQAQEHLLNEVRGAKRKTFILRLHQRYCVLRAADERRELIALLEEISDTQPLPPVATIPSPSLDGPAAAQG